MNYSSQTESASTCKSGNPVTSNTKGVYDSSLIINSEEFTAVVGKLRSFFTSKGFLEAHPQNRLSILAACEDPFTVATFNYDNKVWPLPQTVRCGWNTNFLKIRSQWVFLLIN